MKRFWLLLVLFIPLVTSCKEDNATRQLRVVDPDFVTTGNEQVTIEVDRYGAYVLGIKEIEKTKRSKDDVRIAEANARKAEAENNTKPQVIIQIDTKEEMLAYKDMQTVQALADMGKALAYSNESLSRALENSGNGNLKENYIPFPKSGFAEGVLAFGEAVTSVVQTPAVFGGSLGYMFVELGKEGIKNAGHNNIISDNARQDSSANTASVGRDGDARSSTSESVDLAVEGEGTSGSLDNSQPKTVTNTDTDTRTTTITRTNTDIEN